MKLQTIILMVIVIAMSDQSSGKRPPLGPAGQRVIANVRLLRTSRKMTYKDLSAMLDSLGQPIPVLGLSRMERGERRVDVDDLVALAAALGVSEMALLNESGCPSCKNEPPVGFTCNACGRAG